MEIFFNLSPNSSPLHSLQVENFKSNSRLVVDEDDNVKSGLNGLRTRQLWRAEYLRPHPGFIDLCLGSTCVNQVSIDYNNSLYKHSMTKTYHLGVTHTIDRGESDQMVISIWNHHDVLVSSFRFIWIPMLWVYGHYTILLFSVAVIHFRRQIRLWRLKTVPALKGLKR